MCKVTIVIPNYNGINFIRECLNSVLRQTEAPDCEILVVDNGSSDGSMEVVRDEYPGVRLIALKENTGFCHAVNVGIEESNSPYVLLLNNDTKVRDGFVKHLYRAIESNPRVFSVSAKMLMWDKPELMDDAGDRYCVLGWAYGRGKGKAADGYNKPCEVFSACGGAAIYRKSVFEQLGVFDENHFAYLEDLDVGYRARIYGYKNYYEPLAEVIHYGSASSGSRYNAWKTELAAANSVYVEWKNMPFLQWVINLPFLFVGKIVKFLFFCKKGMGLLYLRGIVKGCMKSLSKEGRTHKIRFRLKNLPNYLRIQGMLYAGVIQILKKY